MINPLLAQNMGRWAEVYFTHPPEERDQAVQNLVRQLEQESKERELEARSSNSATQGVESHKGNLRSVAEQTAVCGGCGHENPVNQRFCGICGVALPPQENLNQENRSMDRVSTTGIQAGAETRGPEALQEVADVGASEREERQHYFLEERPREYASEIEPPMFG